MFTANIELKLTSYQIKQFSKFCENKGLECESIFHDKTGTDEEAEGDASLRESETWYSLSEQFKNHLPKRKEK